MPRTIKLFTLILALLVALASASAQGLSAEAEAALRTGEARMAEALATYPAQYPDRPLWQQAFAEGRRAMQLAPESLAPVRFLAEAYSRSQWAGRAWPAWLEFVERGGKLDDEAEELVAIVGHELGYGAYARGDLDTALEFYLAVSDLVATDVDARVWAGRILLETEHPEQAITFWRSVLALDPNDARAAYFAELARDQATWGTRAVNVFREGIAFYEEGAAQAAAERFARATVLNPAYPMAWAWLGRMAFEAGDYADARRAYANAAGLAPDNETYRYFLAQSIVLAEAQGD